MATAAQITANQANAQHSTGPRTPEGKARSARNHTGHGLSSREFVILPHQEAEFEEFMTGLHADIRPHGYLEHDVFTQFAHAAWNLRRCRQAERELQDSSAACLDPILDAKLDQRLRLIDLYARRSERAYHRLLKELKALQANRQYTAELDRATYDRTFGAQPAPLAPNLALDRFRARVGALAAQRDFRRRVAELTNGCSVTSAEAALQAMAATAPKAPASHAAAAGQSNPIPAPAAASTAR